MLNENRGADVRCLRLEPLEHRLLLASLWQNPDLVLDVNNSGLVTPHDALLVVNDLNHNGIRPLAGDGNEAVAAARFVDVSGDSLVSPLDALLVINALNTAPKELALIAGLAPDSDLDGNGVVLGSEVSVVGQTSPLAAVQLTMLQGLRLSDGESGSEAVNEGTAPLPVTADAEGRFQFDASLPYAINQLVISVRDRLGRDRAVERLVRHGDVITDWNASLLNVVRDWTTASDDPYPGRIVSSEPPRVARNLAMVHAAMYDAMNSVTQTHEPYHFQESAGENVSATAAAAAAAHRVASQLYNAPDELAVWDAALAEALATVPVGSGHDEGIALGERAADAILALRENDGSQREVPYAAGSEPGDWGRTPPGYLPPLLPQWPGVTPFAIASADQFRPPPPPSLDSAEYAVAVDEVMRLGRADSDIRTADQTEIAIFWADGGGTFTPPGHWNQIAADVLLQQGRALPESARTLALLNIALADAGFSAWDAKYAYELWRPVDAVRWADTDGNDATTKNPAWTPLVVTPPFPSYTSGHSTFSGAAAAVLTAVLGSEVAFVSEADGHQGFAQRPLDESEIRSRSFESFQHAAEEAGQSRIYGGIHFRFDDTAGLTSGRAIGAYVVGNLLREFFQRPL